MTQRKPPTRLVWRSLGEAVVTMAAVLFAFATVLLIDPEPGTAVLAVVLTLSLARSQLDRDLRGRLESLVALPLVGLAAAGVGILLHEERWAGATVFVIGMAASIWLRRFGPAARRAGSG